MKKLEWKNCMKVSRDMLDIAKKRNAALDFSEKKEAEFAAIRRKCEAAIADIRRHHDELKIIKLPVAAEYYIKVINDYLLQVKSQYSKYLDTYANAAKMCNTVETYKEYLEMYMSLYEDLKLSKGEFKPEELPEIIALILLANQKNPKITEANFFENVNDFYELVKRNPKLVNLLSSSGDITSVNTLDDYLRNVI